MFCVMSFDCGMHLVFGVTQACVSWGGVLDLCFTGVVYAQISKGGAVCLTFACIGGICKALRMRLQACL
jgi:hypothetical protein